MAWQDRFRALGDELTAGKISTDEYRTRSEEILLEAEREAQQEAHRETAEPAQPERVHIPVSAAWEAPSGEMTQIVGSRDETTPVSSEMSAEISTEIGDRLEDETELVKDDNI